MHIKYIISLRKKIPSQVISERCSSSSKQDSRTTSFDLDETFSMSYAMSPVNSQSNLLSTNYQRIRSKQREDGVGTNVVDEEATSDQVSTIPRSTDTAGVSEIDRERNICLRAKQTEQRRQLELLHEEQRDLGDRESEERKQSRIVQRKLLQERNVAARKFKLRKSLEESVTDRQIDDTSSQTTAGTSTMTYATPCENDNQVGHS